MNAWDSDFVEWMGARTPALLRYSYMLTGDREAAADLLQEVLIKVGARWGHAKKAGPEAYVRRALTNQALSERKRWRRETTVSHMPEGIVPDMAPRAETGLDVKRALALLPPRQRAAIVLRYYEGYTELMIAQTLDCSVGTVKSQLHKASVSLRERLHPEDSRSGES